MPQLNELRAAVDAGRTAKHKQWRSILHYLVRKENGFYGKQAQGYKNEIGIVIVSPATTFYATWEDLLASLNGFYTDDEWWTTDEPFSDYLPPERDDSYLS
jgi:hypothetical protein